MFSPGIQRLQSHQLSSDEKKKKTLLKQMEAKQKTPVTTCLAIFWDQKDMSENKMGSAALFSRMKVGKKFACFNHFPGVGNSRATNGVNS